MTTVKIKKQNAQKIVSRRRPEEKNRKVIELIKDGLGGKIMKQLAGLRANL